MRVSVSLHTRKPELDGNQRDFEAIYRDYNRSYAELVVDPTTGNAQCVFDKLDFPRVPDEDQLFTHFSIGVCVGPADQGGSIINAGPLTPELRCPVGATPQLVNVMVGVGGSRLAAMRADKRLFEES